MRIGTSGWSYNHYPDRDLRRWAALIAEWDSDGRDVWLYFNNDFGGHAVRNALSLRTLLG